MSGTRGTLDYAGAGVSPARGHALVEAISAAAGATRAPGVMAGLGGFGALFDPRAAGLRDPILVSGADGVGTKLLVAIEASNETSNEAGPALHDGLGQDCVAMCVNDVLCHGARPLFFLDYLATGALDVDAAARIVRGVARACEAAGCALVGGETAEMPGLYAPGHYDLAGFCVGAVERSDVLPRLDAVRPGDAVVGVATSGAHSNGFSLIRALVADLGLNWNGPSPFGGGTLAEALLAPTALYSKAALAALVSAGEGVRSMAHITGGGLPENLPRALPEGLGARLFPASWALPPVFEWVLGTGRIERAEAYRTFNMGLGLCLVTAPDAAQGVVDVFGEHGHAAGVVGEVIETTGERVVLEGVA